MKKNFKILLFYPNEPLNGVAPTHLAILSACLKQDGFDVKLFDTTLYKFTESIDDIREKLGHTKKSPIDEYFITKKEDMYEDFIKTVEDYKPNLIGFSVLDGTITFSFSFIEKIKEKNIPIIMGGIGATFNYEKILNSNLVNFVCIGEGEETIVELCNKLMNNKDCYHIKNLYYKNNNIIIKNPKRQLIDLNTLPIPDFSIYEYYRFYRPYYGKIIRSCAIDTDRGCPFDCTYCASPSIKNLYKIDNCEKYYRIKNLDKIFEEMNHTIKTYDINFIFMSSETFLAWPLKKFKTFVERYKEEINLPFHCQTRLDTITNEKTQLLVKMGCKSIAVSIEHGSKYIRQNLLNKHLSNKQIIEAFTIIANYNIVSNINNMIGLPGETRENIFETIKLNKTVSEILKGKHSLNIFTFIPFAGTKLRKMCIEKKYIEGNEDIPLSYFKHSLLNMPSLSKEEIYGLEKTFVLYTLLPESYWPDIKIAEQENEEGKKMFDKLMKIKNKQYLKI